MAPSSMVAGDRLPGGVAHPDLQGSECNGTLETRLRGNAGPLPSRGQAAAMRIAARMKGAAERRSTS